MEGSTKGSKLGVLYWPVIKKSGSGLVDTWAKGKKWGGLCLMFGFSLVLVFIN